MSQAVPEPELSEAERRALAHGVAEFNAGYFFECHDTLEEMWSGLRGPSRDFFQGLIQVSVALYHLTSGNLAGAESMLGRALKRFDAYPDSYLGFDLSSHRRELEAWRIRVTAGSADEISVEQLPKWRFAGLEEAR